MPNYISTLALVIIGATSVLADEPLASKHFDFNNLPYQADTADGPRGTQVGINRCNSTTEGQDSLCQTAQVNSPKEWCIWGARKPNSLVANEEEALVAWCTKPGMGARVMPEGTITSMTYVKTPDYVQITGTLNQQQINLAANDSGGEEDPHGADGRGNPLGSLMYSLAFDNTTHTQCSEWINFLGGGQFCIRCCDPKGKEPAKLCEHIYDRIGCAYNAPALYQPGVFEACDGDNQDPVGTYTGADGRVSTYFQPPESLGPITSIPYTPKIPASSNCVTFQSSQLFAAAASAFPATASTAAGSKITSSPSRTSGGSPSPSAATSSKQASDALSVGPRSGGLLALAGVLAAVMA